MRVFVHQFYQQIFAGDLFLYSPPALKDSHCKIIFSQFSKYFLNTLFPICHHFSGNRAPRNRDSLHMPMAEWHGRKLLLCSLATHLCICKTQTHKLFCRHSMILYQVQFAIIWCLPGLFLKVLYQKKWQVIYCFLLLFIGSHFCNFSLFLLP